MCAGPLRKALQLLAGFGFCLQASGAEDIEFVAEHIAELPMDNRFATLPVWAAGEDLTAGWSFAAQAGYGNTTSGNLEVAGPMLSVAVSRPLGSRWTLGALAFADTLNLSGDRDYRPLQTLFAPDLPIAFPVAARFDDLDGRERHYGGGLHLSLASDNGWFGAHRWVGGLLWQRVELQDYRLTYRILDGAAAGVSGLIDFDATYSYVTPFIGLEAPRSWTLWSISPHVLAAWPIAKHGVVGHITGPGFDLRGDSETSGYGAHIGDPSLTLGLGISYLPAHVTIDVGTLLTQRLIEPFINKGIEANWLLSCQWRFGD